ncbi:hypothetical protein S83_004781, partial [Arachis hypogaea]
VGVTKPFQNSTLTNPNYNHQPKTNQPTKTHCYLFLTNYSPSPSFKIPKPPTHLIN